MRATAIVILAACGGGTGSPSGGVDAAGGGPDAQTPTKAGGVTIQSYVATNTTGGSASASFSSTASGCTTTMMGPCAVGSCTTATPTPASAGTLTIAGATQPISLVPGADKTYTALTETTALFAGGETLTVTAEGADVPAFTGHVIAPGKVTITAPAKPPTSSPYLIVDRSRDFTVSWTGGSGEVMVYLDGGTGRAQTIRCTFAASAGVGMVPAAALATLPAGMGGFAMATIADTTVVAGDYAIDVEGYFNAVWSADGAIVSGPTTYQ